MAELQGKFTGKNYVRWIWAASILVPIVVGVLLNPRVEDMMPEFSESVVNGARKLPYVNATFNSLVSICLVLGVVFISRKDRRKHQIMMLSAFTLSAFFLVTYVSYHVVVGHVPYCEGNLVPKGIYYSVLISHIFLSVSIIPLASFSIYRALNETFDRHKKLARITFPLWLYVSVTGVLVVIFNSPCY